VSAASSRKTALISAFNKDGIEGFASALISMGWNILSSGGTAKKLREAGIEARDVAELVGGGAILGHRVVTLSRQIHAALLADTSKPGDMAELERLGIPVVDLVCCDFYPLSKAINEPGASVGSVVEMTDIGGPTMVRSAAKGGRIVICRPEDRQPVIDELKATGSVSPENRQKLRAIAEAEVARYVATSAAFHSNGGFVAVIGGRVLTGLKAENACQGPASLFSTGSGDPLAMENFRQIDGAPASYNNVTDIDRCLQTATHIVAAIRPVIGATPFIGVGVKHGNPCGASATKKSPEMVVKRTVTGDCRAIFGGTLLFNFPITKGLAETMVTEGMKDGQKQKFDCVVAPSFDDGACEVLGRKGGKCRMIVNPALAGDGLVLDTAPRIRPVRGGFLMEKNYTFVLDLKRPDVSTVGSLDPVEELNLLLAWAVCVTSNSNTITIVSGGMLIGNGVGQQDRVGAAELAVKRTRDAGHGDKLKRAVVCSDSFFPFNDGPQALIDAGIKTIFSTSGSQNDTRLQELCRSSNVTLVQLKDDDARGFFGH
jgi:phosphoribosylaminoimidazolecarboxamide formyltransferase/IMP cyclohydrolase